MVIFEWSSVKKAKQTKKQTELRYLLLKHRKRVILVLWFNTALFCFLIISSVRQIQKNGDRTRTRHLCMNLLQNTRIYSIVCFFVHITGEVFSFSSLYLKQFICSPFLESIRRQLRHPSNLKSLSWPGRIPLHVVSSLPSPLPPCEDRLLGVLKKK